MRKFLSRLIVAIAPCTVSVPSHVQAADLLKVHVKVQQEKHNAVVHFSKAAIGQFGVPSGSEANAFIGVTADFGATLPAYILGSSLNSL